jgi:hypothetical protein
MNQLMCFDGINLQDLRWNSASFPETKNDPENSIYGFKSLLLLQAGKRKIIPAQIC